MSTPETNNNPESYLLFQTPLIAPNKWDTAVREVSKQPSLCAQFEAEQPSLATLLRDYLSERTDTYGIDYGLRIATATCLALSKQYPKQPIPYITENTVRMMEDHLYQDESPDATLVDFMAEQPHITDKIVRSAGITEEAADATLGAAMLTMHCIQIQVMYDSTHPN